MRPSFFSRKRRPSRAPQNFGKRSATTRNTDALRTGKVMVGDLDRNRRRNWIRDCFLPYIPNRKHGKPEIKDIRHGNLLKRLSPVILNYCPIRANIGRVDRLNFVGRIFRRVHKNFKSEIFNGTKSERSKRGPPRPPPNVCRTLERSFGRKSDDGDFARDQIKIPFFIFPNCEIKSETPPWINAKLEDDERAGKNSNLSNCTR